MADQELESGLEAPETPAAPLPKISEPSGVEPASAPAVDAEALVRLNAKIDEMAKVLDRQVRGLQSGVDRQISKLTNVDAIARALGVAPEKVVEAQRTVALNEIVDERLSSPVSDPGRSPTLESRSTEAILAQVKADFGVELAPNDPELVEAAKKTYSSWDAWDNTVNKIGARRLKQGAVSQTAVVAETQQKPPSGNTLEAALTNLKRVQGDQKARPADIQKAMTAYQEALARQR